MKKLTALLLSLFMLASPVCTAEGAYSSLAETLYQASYELSDGLTYTRELVYHPTYGAQREYSLIFQPGSDTRLSFVNGSRLYHTATVRSLVAEELPEENYVAGINADFFNLSTGVPESAYIKDGELYTTDRDSFCLAEDEDGHFFIDKPLIKLLLTASETGTEYNILHLNKEFSEYGLYLYNARYSDKTHISVANTTVALCPYSERLTEEELLARLKDDCENGLLMDEGLYETLNAYLTLQNDTQGSIQPEMMAVLRSNALEQAAKYYELQKLGQAYYCIEPPHPSIGQSEKLVVLRVNTAAENESLPADCYMLCAANSSYGYILMTMSEGDTFRLDITGNPVFDTVKNAVGTGTVIVRDSQVVDDRSFSHYMSAQPRSAVGIRADGSLVFYAVDGRQKNYSAGLTLYDLGERMLSLDCVYAANLDGGGSTVVNASLPGNDLAVTVSSPSGKTERRVSNGIAFTNTLPKTGIPVGAYAYGDHYLTLSDTPISLGELVLADENGYAAVSEKEVALYTKNGLSSVEAGSLMPNGADGTIEVFASLDGGQTENVAATVVSLAEPDSITLTADKAHIAPYETVCVSAAASYRGLHVSSSLSSYTWLLSDESGDSSESLGQVADGIFTPLSDGKTITISAVRGNARADVPVTVDAYPFADMKGHWAVKEIYALAKDGVVNGELDASGVPYYLPERTYSRFEFFTMLSRLTQIGSELDLPTEEEKSAAFADASLVPAWAAEAVWRLWQTGLLEDVIHWSEAMEPILDGASPITRGEVIRVMGKICDPAPLDFTLEGFSDLNELERITDTIKNAVSAGIFSGYEDGTLRLHSQLTRAEGAAVFVRLKAHLDASTVEEMPFRVQMTK